MAAASSRNAQRGELIRDFPEREQHRLPVDGVRLILRRARLIGYRVPASDIEDIDEQGQALYALLLDDREKSAKRRFGA
jgi:hypothetical protein